MGGNHTPSSELDLSVREVIPFITSGYDSVCHDTFDPNWMEGMWCVKTKSNSQLSLNAFVVNASRRLTMLGCRIWRHFSIAENASWLDTLHPTSHQSCHTILRTHPGLTLNPPQTVYTTIYRTHSPIYRSLISVRLTYPHPMIKR